MTVYDLVMSCDNVCGSTTVKLYLDGCTIIPEYEFVLTDYLDNTDLYEESKHMEVSHFSFNGEKELSIYAIKCVYE